MRTVFLLYCLAIFTEDVSLYMYSSRKSFLVCEIFLTNQCSRSLQNLVQEKGPIFFSWYQPITEHRQRFELINCPDQLRFRLHVCFLCELSLVKLLYLRHSQNIKPFHLTKLKICSFIHVLSMRYVSPPIAYFMAWSDSYLERTKSN